MCAAWPTSRLSTPSPFQADSLALVARLGISASIIFSFPLNFVGLREGVLDLLNLKGRAQEDTVHRASTVLLLAAVSTVSLFLKDLGLVVAFGGAALPNALPNPSP